MPFLDRAATFLADRVAPHLLLGKGPRNGLTLEAIERQASEEIQARIRMGRPGPEEARRTRPLPAWAQPRRRRTRRLDVIAVDLDALATPLRAPAPQADTPRVTAPARLSRQT
jgi:hypothetical protein